MAASMPDAKFVAIEGVGHAVFVDAPEQFDDLLRTFLESLPQS
jgi:pimeloyl-ACP methyl ester carboxylesterase